MENASKALIIAGAILLSILIISLGIMIFTQASSVVDNNAMDEVAVTTFNEKFRQYEGNNVRGANVNALLQRVVQNNITNEGDSSKQIKVKCSAKNWSGTKSTGEKIAITSEQLGKALTGKSYSVNMTPDPKSGYYTEITINDAGASSSSDDV